MIDEDFIKLLVVAGISAGMTPKDAIATAYETVRLAQIPTHYPANDEA